MTDRKFFDSTVALFEIYRKKMNSESPTSYNNQLALEVRKRPRQLSFICAKVREYEQTVMKLTPRMFGVDLEQLSQSKNKPLPSSELFKPYNFPEYKTAWFEMEFFVESFYYLADRTRKVVSHKKRNTFPGLKNFCANGIREVRNQLLQHPEDFDQISSRA